jgi:hypothetical protein
MINCGDKLVEGYSWEILINEGKCGGCYVIAGVKKRDKMDVFIGWG